MPELWMKEQPVLAFEEEGGAVTAITKVEQEELLPLYMKNNCTVEKMNEWLQKRSIPSAREGIDEVCSMYGGDWKQGRTRASLSDQYWVKYRFEEYQKVNFFTRRYPTDIGDIFFKPWKPLKKIRNDSPDLTTNGILRKCWRQKDDLTSYLVKAGSRATHQEPLSEILVSVLLEQLQIIPFVRYDYCVEGVTLCSCCDNFITKDTELIPASHIYFQEERGKNESIYGHLVRMCDKYEIEDARKYIDSMIFIDTITGNEDRNLGNIGFIRDVNTRKITPAPLFDFGAAYWSSGKINNSVKSKTFGNVEQRIFNRMKNKCDMEVLVKNKEYKHCIETYPRISDAKKENLISAISKRNQTLVLEQEMGLDI